MSLQKDKDNRRVSSALRKVGVEVTSPYDLVNTSEPYPEAIPVLIDLLPQIDELDVKEGIARALTTREARGQAERPLLREFLELGTSKQETLVKWAIGNALRYLADEKLYDDIVRIVKDPSHGPARQELVTWLGKMKNKRPGVVTLLIRLLKDDDVTAHALEALAKLKAVEAREAVTPLLKHERPLVRRLAAKALKAMDRAAG